MTLGRSLLALLAALSLGSLFGCVVKTTNDCASTCNGCCDSAGACQSGSANGACGSGGGACVVCNAQTETCQNNLCVQTQPSCAPGNCAGCCNASGQCVALPSQNDALCGAGGIACGTCPGGTNCVSGGCVAPGCTDGTYECQGNDLYICSGAQFTLFQQCAAGVETCTVNSAGTTGDCACTDGAYACLGSDTDVYVCSGGRFVLDSHCDPGYQCSSTGACVCKTGATTCVGNDLYTCSAGAFQYSQSCGAGATCSNGACVANACTNGQMDCDQNTPLTCTNGQWVAAANPCAAGSYCLSGQCVTCGTAGTYACSGNDLYICTSSGAWQYDSTCSNGYSCQESAGTASCVASCTAGTPPTCSGQDIYVCQGGGWVYQSTCASNQYCDNGVCYATVPNCGVSSSACTNSGDCSAGFACLDAYGYACAANETGCACNYGVCGVAGNTCQNSLDCCTGYACEAINGGNYCVAVSGRSTGDACHANTDCANGTCNQGTGCYGTCN